MTRTVCIVGLAPSSRDRIADEPAGGDMWGLNMGHAYFAPEVLSKFTAWFQMHPWEEMAPRQNPRLRHLEWLKTCGIPVYMEEQHPEVPTSLRYPYEAVCETIHGTYLTSQPAFMLALAIHQGYDLIKLYGIDMNCEREWAYERACFEHLLGIAVGRGIRIWMPEDCPLLKGPIYGKTVDIPSSYLVEQLRQLQREEAEIVGRLNQNQGKQDLLERLIDMAYAGPDRLGNARSGVTVSQDGEVKADPLGIIGGNRVGAIEP